MEARLEFIFEGPYNRDFRVQTTNILCGEAIPFLLMDTFKYSKEYFYIINNNITMLTLGIKH